MRRIWDGETTRPETREEECERVMGNLRSIADFLERDRRVVAARQCRDAIALLDDLCYPPRPMTGILNTLTDEQKALAVAYDGPENIGSDEFRTSIALIEKHEPASTENKTAV